MIKKKNKQKIIEMFYNSATTLEHTRNCRFVHFNINL